MSDQNVPSGPVFGPTQQTTVVGFERRERPGALAILFGIFTILVSVGLAVVSVLLGVGMFGSGDAETGMIGIALSCVPILFSLYGLFSGAMLSFVGGAAGKVLAIIFWVILIAGGLCIGLLFATAIIGPEFFGIY
jgi:hypothetical protein